MWKPVGKPVGKQVGKPVIVFRHVEKSVCLPYKCGMLLPYEEESASALYIGKHIPLWWECHIWCLSSVGCILLIYEDESIPRLDRGCGILIHGEENVSLVSMKTSAYLSSTWAIYSPLVSISGLLPPSSLSSAIPYVFLMNLCRPMFLRHPVGFDGYLAGISLPICTLFSFVNIGACMLRIPLCLIEHVGVLQKSAWLCRVHNLCVFCVCFGNAKCVIGQMFTVCELSPSLRKSNPFKIAIFCCNYYFQKIRGECYACDRKFE